MNHNRRNHSNNRTDNTRTQKPNLSLVKSGNVQEDPPYINVRELNLTEYISANKLMFNKREDEIWTLTEGQRAFRNAFEEKDALILRGPAGSGKTDITAREVLGFLHNGGCNRILLTAPIDEGGEEIGFRKGDVKEKMHEHVAQYLAAFDGHLGQGNFNTGRKIREALMHQGVIEVKPMGTLSGDNLRRTVLIVDEAHKARMQHLLIAMTRLHNDGSKVIFSGDEKQHISNGVSAFRSFVERFSNEAYNNHIAVINYTAQDIKRHPLIKTIAERGDDIPPGLAERMKAEQFTEEKIKTMLARHFESSASGKKNPLAEQAVRTYLSRQPDHVLLDILEDSLDGSAPEIG